MNKIRVLIGTALIAAPMVNAVLVYREIRKTERIKRNQILIDQEKDLDAIKTSALRMEAKLKDPNYRPTGIKQVLDDLEFERIAARNE